mmetsp:Transcript_5850/g.16532  ORF Transcript_5850/g.16532 Transcript_5850/m.16532 type:complete len:252 (-) Transcript_5850:1-756(-)
MFLAKSVTSTQWLQHSRRFWCRSQPVLFSRMETRLASHHDYFSWTTTGIDSRRFCCTATSHAHMIEDDDHDETGMPDYFALFGVPRRYALDPKELQQSYRNLMAKYHPDRRNQQQQSVGKSSDNYDDDDMDASQITNAYQTLREPHTRATYLLELEGRPMEETANAVSLVRPEFLMEVMEWRETIDSIDLSNQDDAMKELEDLLRHAQNEIQGVISQLDMAFDEQDLDRAMQLSAQLQYWHRIEETIQDKM